MFNSQISALSLPLTTKIRAENIVKLQLQNNLVKVLAQLIHDLAVSPITFERDFDKNYKLIEENIRNLQVRDYAKYKSSMVDKYKRGQIKKNNNELRAREEIASLKTRLVFLRICFTSTVIIFIALIGYLLLK